MDHFGNARDRAVGLFGSIFPVGTMIGPIFGGLFVTYWSWRDIFFINVPIGLAVMLLALRYIPHDRTNPELRSVPMDLPGLVLLGAALFGVMLGASFAGEPGMRFASPTVLLPLLAGFAATALFVLHIRRSAHPFIAPRFIYGQGFSAVNLINVAYGGVTGGIVLLAPLYATNRYGISALSSGTLLVAQGLASVVFSVLAVVVIRRTGYRGPIALGGLCVAAGLLLLAVPPQAGASPYGWLAGSAVLVGVGLGWRF